MSVFFFFKLTVIFSCSSYLVLLQNPLSILLLPFLSNLCYSFGICDLCSSCGNARFTPDWDQIGHRSNWLLTRCATVGIPWFLCHVKASWSEGIRPAQQCDPESQAGVDHPPGGWDHDLCFSLYLVLSLASPSLFTRLGPAAQQPKALLPYRNLGDS